MVILMENSSLTLLLCAFLCHVCYLCDLFSKMLFDETAVNTEFIPLPPIYIKKIKNIGFCNLFKMDDSYVCRTCK